MEVAVERLVTAFRDGEVSTGLSTNRELILKYGGLRLMKIHLYKNEPDRDSRSLLDVIKQISGMPLQQRERVVREKIIFLEDFKKMGAGGFYAVDFTTRREDNGPGHSVSGKETEDFPLENDAGFGEQAAFVYHPEKEYLAVQYNQYGPRAASIAKYFSEFSTHAAPDHFDWKPVFDDNVMQKLQRSKSKTKLSYKLDMSSVSKEMSREIGIEHAYDLWKKYNAAIIEITVSLGRGERGKSIRDVFSAVSNIRSLKDSVKRLQAQVKVDDDSNAEILNLLDHQSMKEIDNKKLTKTKGLRYTFGSRAKIIREVLREWLQSR